MDLSGATQEQVEHFIGDIGMQLAKESDRGCALVSAAWLDDLLGRWLRKRFIEQASAVDELLDSNRALGTFSAKIALVHALGWISAEEKHDLDLIRKIRNSAAHFGESGDAFREGFEAERVRSWCGSLKLPTRELREAAGTTRRVFLQVVSVLIGVLHARIEGSKHAEVSQASVATIFQDPEFLQLVRLTAAIAADSEGR